MPCELLAIVIAFAPLFTKPVFCHVQVLIQGAILSPSARTVAWALRAMGKSDEKNFQNYHRVLNRDEWSSLHVPSGVILIGMDEHNQNVGEARRSKPKGFIETEVAFITFTFCESEWSAVALVHVIGEGSVRRQSLGVTISECALSI